MLKMRRKPTGWGAQSPEGSSGWLVLIVSLWRGAMRPSLQGLQRLKTETNSHYQNEVVLPGEEVLLKGG